MSEINFPAFLIFAIVTTFTPGPNNISSASSGVLYGYRRTLPYIAGIVSGFFGVMLASALLSQSIRAVLPKAEGYLRIAGAIYILWLAYHSLKSSYQFEAEGIEPRGFRAGVLLQALNPKALVYGLTMYSSFLLPLANRPFELALSAAFFAVLTFVAVSVWSLTGAAIRRYMRTEAVQQAVNTILAVLLVYTAYEISGL